MHYIMKVSILCVPTQTRRTEDRRREEGEMIGRPAMPL